MNSSRRLEQFARLGFAARGIVYVLVGWLALRAAIWGGRPSDNQGALADFEGLDGGDILLAAMAFGLAGYGVWRLLDALLNPQEDGAKGAALRVGYAGSGLAHLFLASFAASLSMGERGDTASQDESARNWAAVFLDLPLGQGLLILGGLIGIGIGLYQMRKAWKGDFMDELGGGAPKRDWICPAGRVGYAARGIVFGLMGLFLILAGVHGDANEAGGMSEALATLQSQPNGALLLGISGIGLILFGLFSIVEALYRRIDAPDVEGRIKALH